MLAFALLLLTPMRRVTSRPQGNPEERAPLCYNGKEIFCCVIKRGQQILIENRSGAACYMQFEQYEQFPELVHGIFTREGGYSQPPYHSLNVSLSSGRERYEDAVRNRFRVLQSLDIAEYTCATMWMIHSARVINLDKQDWPDWGEDWPHRIYELDELGYPTGTRLQWTFKPRTQGDALITRKRGVALAISTADCVPLLFYDPVTQAIGVAHAGWRGTARGIAAATVAAMSEQLGARLTNIRAGVGPSIGPCCYEVSEEVSESGAAAPLIGMKVRKKREENRQTSGKDWRKETLHGIMYALKDVKQMRPWSRAMESVSQVAQILSQILETEANHLARETGWQQRKRILSGADFVQTLIFGWLQEPDISLDGLVQVAARRGVPHQRQWSQPALHPASVTDALACADPPGQPAAAAPADLRHSGTAALVFSGVARR